MSAKLIGAHMPTSKGLGNAIRKGKEIGCNTLQVFTSSPQQWNAKVITPELIEDVEKARVETGIGTMVSHDSYLINLCSLDPEHRQKSFNGLKGELERSAQLGIGYVVSHMGASKGQTEEEALKIVAEATLEILAQTPQSVTLCMETTAGQGSSLNYRFEHLATILDHCGHPSRLGVCLDTCHIFAAGYDIRTQEGFEKTFEEFERVIGFKNLKVVHCNDSKKAFGSKVDRHAGLGEGEIGPVPFELMVNDKRFENIPIIVETPEAETMHEVNVGRLLAWRSN